MHVSKFLKLLVNRVQPAEPLLGRYWVKSESEDSEYLVDVDAYWGSGWCMCSDFRIRHEVELNLLPRNERTFGAFDSRFRCKHIIAARLYEGLELLQARIKVVKHSEEGW